MRPRNNVPAKNHWTGPQRGLKLVNNKAARFAIAAFPALRFRTLGDIRPNDSH